MEHITKKSNGRVNFNVDLNRHTAAQSALIQLGNYLKDNHYQFTTITPESHRLVLSRNHIERTNDSLNVDLTLRDFFGWNRPVLKKNLPVVVQKLIVEANSVIQIDDLHLKSKVRFSTLDNNLFLHSSYPTIGSDAVFFGPDTYRFIRFLKNKINTAKVIIDLGCGPGTAGIVLSDYLNTHSNSPVEKIYLSDINETALNYASINVAINHTNHAVVTCSNMLDDIPSGADLVIANPPFIIDTEQRLYRHGGENYGSQLSVQMVKSALDYLKPGGMLALYTGSCIVHGKDIVLDQIQQLINQYNADFKYEEIDCDIFGEELNQANYINVDRIAAVSLIITKR